MCLFGGGRRPYLANQLAHHSVPGAIGRLPAIAAILHQLNFIIEANDFGHHVGQVHAVTLVDVMSHKRLPVRGHVTEHDVRGCLQMADLKSSTTSRPTNVYTGQPT